MTEALTAPADAPAPFTPLNDLEVRLIAAANGGPEERAAFERALADEALFVATPEDFSDGRPTPEPGGRLTLFSVPLNDGRSATALFTAAERIGGFAGPDSGVLQIPVKVLFEMISSGPAYLNPGHQYGVLWEPTSLALIAGVPLQREIKRDTQLLLGTPTDVPTQLMAQLSRTFGPLPQVQAAWLALAHWPETDERGWYLDVRADGDPEPIRRALGEMMRQAETRGLPLDMVINKPGGKDGVGLLLGAGRKTPAKPEKKGWLGKLFG